MNVSVCVCMCVSLLGRDPVPLFPRPTAETVPQGCAGLACFCMRAILTELLEVTLNQWLLRPLSTPVGSQAFSSLS